MFFKFKVIYTNIRLFFIFICYCTEKKLVPIIIDYCPFQFDALKFFLNVRLHGRSLPNFNFFNVTPKFFNEIVKFTSQIAQKQIFTTFLALV